MKSSYLPLDGLKILTDDVGIFQHTKFSTISRKEGYTTDDNARALIAALMHYNHFKVPDSIGLAKTYLSFLLHMQREDGSFHNIMGFDRQFKDKIGSEDCMGHSLWACGFTLSRNISEEMKPVAKEIFDICFPYSRLFTSPRAKALTILGLHHYQRAYPQDGNVELNINEISSDLITQYNIESEKKWRWFESYLTYANARLPQSMFAAYLSTRNSEYLKIGLESLDFLIGETISKGIFMPIGTNGWYIKGKKKAVYDQQPIEASCMVEASVLAYEITQESVYEKVAKAAFNWYHGNNAKNAILVDRDKGICFDGITTDGLNQNQGAESTISYYMAYLTMYEKGLID
jgi:hypothetical protein